MSIAELMLDGTLCEGCGASIPGEAPGYPRYCSKRCRKDREPAAPAKSKVPCPVCSMRIKAAGLQDHMRAKHAKGTPHG